MYQVEVGRCSIDEALRYNASELGLTESAREFAEQLCRGALARRAEIDRLLEEYSIDWRVERMPYVDRNILRLAVYELLHEPSTPPSVAVNEAVELAKMYGDANSGRFINGILGSILRTLRQGSEPQNEPQHEPQSD